MASLKLPGESDSDPLGWVMEELPPGSSISKVLIPHLKSRAGASYPGNIVWAHIALPDVCPPGPRKNILMSSSQNPGR